MNTLSVHVRAKRHSPHTCTVANLQFSARAGEFIAIVGPSGAGKTTLLKIISGLDTAFDGEIRLPAGATLGYMFQEARLMPWLTVLENLQLIPSAMQRQQLLEMLEMVGLKECASLYPRQLSGGMQRRVALLRAFIVQPQLLLMDEPFQALDAPTAAQLRAQLMALWQRSEPTVLFVTHHLTDALALASRVLFLSAAPARVALDWQVDLPAGRDVDSPQVQALARHLLQTYPQLLSGSAVPQSSDCAALTAPAAAARACAGESWPTCKNACSSEAPP